MLMEEVGVKVDSLKSFGVLGSFHSSSDSRPTLFSTEHLKCELCNKETELKSRLFFFNQIFFMGT